MSRRDDTAAMQIVHLLVRETKLAEDRLGTLADRLRLLAQAEIVRAELDSSPDAPDGRSAVMRN